MSKRGISPLIATVLLIGFTVILAILVITWVTGVVENTTEETSSSVDAQHKCLNSIGDLVARFTDTAGFPPYKIDIINEGSTDYETVQIMWSDSGSTNAYTSSITALAGYSSDSSLSDDNVYDMVTLIPIVDGYACNSVEVEIDL